MVWSMVNDGVQRTTAMCRSSNAGGSSQSTKGNRMIGPPARLRKKRERERETEREREGELIITGHR